MEIMIKELDMVRIHTQPNKSVYFPIVVVDKYYSWDKNYYQIVSFYKSDFDFVQNYTNAESLFRNLKDLSKIQVLRIPDINFRKKII